MTHAARLGAFALALTVCSPIAFTHGDEGTTTAPQIIILKLDDITTNDAQPGQRWSQVDQQGVLRWRDDNSEIALFGVNYYTPFTVDYLGVEKLGLAHQEVIRQDVDHFERLGLDAIRLHVFDREISDVQGNLLANEHLDLFDYLVWQCKQRGIYTFLTPIAWWHYYFDDGGFSSLYTKPQMVLDPQARKAQANYLRQFMEHVNPYTGQAYKDEPAVVAIELINEPQYDATTTMVQIRDYIDQLAAAVRSSGATQPIFYNGWDGKEEAVGQSTAEGCSFGWYPTGLVSGGCLRNNYLTLVDDYPNMRLECLNHKAKIVYEFDAADVPGRVMYPAMARTFRSGGAQIAAQFQYDPLPLAAYNYGWQTHYLNLVYAPGKTLSYAIAAEVFRRTPRLTTFPPYPDNTRFGAFRIDYERDLSEMVTDEVFLYANSTDTAPPAPQQLTRVAGVGSSPIVTYGGTGAYFLDKVADGVWRLELYPDAIWVDDPFARTSLERAVSRVIWTRHAMQIDLPDLGNTFSYQRLAPATAAQGVATEGTLDIEPGVYQLARQGVQYGRPVNSEFHAPRTPPGELTAWWQCPDTWRAGIDLPVQIVVAAADVRQAVLYLESGDGLPMVSVEPYVYRTTVPAARLTIGQHHLRLKVDTSTGTHWLPQPGSDSSDTQVYVSPSDGPIPLFTADHQRVRLEGQENRRSSMVPGSHSDHKAVRISTDSFAPSPAAIYFRSVVPEQTRAWSDALASCNAVVITARALTDATHRLELVLLEQDNAPWGTEVPVTTQWQEIVVPLTQLRFFQHWAHPSNRGAGDDHFHPEQIGAANVCFGAWLYGDQADQPHGYEIESITLERREVPAGEQDDIDRPED